MTLELFVDPGTEVVRSAIISADGGVSLDKRAAERGYPSIWKAAIRVHQRQILLGRFHTEEDAARAYDAAAIQHFGEFAATNENFELYVRADQPLEVW